MYLTGAARMTLGALFQQRAQAHPQAPALTDGSTTLSYEQLALRVACFAAGLRKLKVRRGDRVAIWSENRFEYLELELAAAQLGVIVACLNWRLTDDEQRHCIRLVEPALVIVSERHAPALQRLGKLAPRVLLLDAAFAGWRDGHLPIRLDESVDPEDGLVILYTSGTTGLPKGALVSQRAMMARAMVLASDYGIGAGDGFIAWSPLFHMAATDQSLATLLMGGKVMVSDGLDLPRLTGWLQTEEIGWLLAMPGMIEQLIEALRPIAGTVKSVRMVGAMADLVPRQQVAELSALVQAPYLNTFGSTETGLPPASAALLPIGAAPERLAKKQNGWCLMRLVDQDDHDVPAGTPGEVLVRGPTVFSGYWGDAAATRGDFRDGWYHMGDLFVRHADGSMDFVDRLKYLIKSGGENIYPAEIERVLLSHPAVKDAAVVRKPDPRWGEVPVAFIACAPEAFDAAALQAFCRERLAAHKVPKDLRRIDLGDLPRSSTGKIQRHELEKRL